MCHRVAVVAAAAGAFAFMSQLPLTLTPLRRSRRCYYDHRIAVAATSVTIALQSLLLLSSSHDSRCCCTWERREWRAGLWWGADTVRAVRCGRVKHTYV